MNTFQILSQRTSLSHFNGLTSWQPSPYAQMRSPKLNFVMEMGMTLFPYVTSMHVPKNCMRKSPRTHQKNLKTFWWIISIKMRSPHGEKIWVRKTNKRKHTRPHKNQKRNTNLYKKPWETKPNIANPNKKETKNFLSQTNGIIYYGGES